MHGFELLRKVADGSAAEAFLARAPGSKQSVLVEVSRAEVLDDVELYGRFLDRAMGRKEFHHPSLLERHSAGCGPDGRVYVATEAVDGPTLADRLSLHGAFGPFEAVRLMSPICSALHYLHSRSVVHGNLSPRNIYLSGSSTQPIPKLLDMGLLLFRTNRSLKTPFKVKLVAEPYLSPERAAGQRADVRSDVYGLGVLLFELLTGRPPYAVRSLHQTAQMPMLPLDAMPLAEIVRRCLAKEPRHRFQSAREVQLALEEAQVERDVLDTLDIQVALNEPPPILLGTQLGIRKQPRPAPEKAMVGPYEILKPLGEGGMGRVFLAKHVKLHRLVALKTLKAAYAADPLHMQRFIQEARAVNRVRHPNLVEIFDFLQEGPGRVCCVMEPLFGETVKERAKRQPMKVIQTVSIIRQACSALAAVHRAGVIHRDVKPDNLFLVDRDGQPDFVKVLDFGIAQVLDDEESMLSTRPGEVVGTPAYMAPEQTVPGDLDGRADIYALGVVAYVLLQGRFPHDATVPEKMIAQKVLQKPRPVSLTSVAGESIPRGLRAIVDRCLQRSPGARFQTMDALSEALARFETEPVTPQPHRHPGRWMAGAGALAVCAAAWWWSRNEAKPAVLAQSPAMLTAPVPLEPDPTISLIEVRTHASPPAVDVPARGAIHGALKAVKAKKKRPPRQ